MVLLFFVHINKYPRLQPVINKIATKVLSWTNFVGIVAGILFAASVFFDRVCNQKARDTINFLPYREVTLNSDSFKSK
jgi:hypothetical protein